MYKMVIYKLRKDECKSFTKTSAGELVHSFTTEKTNVTVYTRDFFYPYP